MSPEIPQPPRPSLTPRVLIGAFLILMGISIALTQLGFVNASHWTRYWPVVMILCGFLVLQRGRQGVVSGSLLILIGGWLLLNTLHVLTLEPWEFFWPLILVVVGTRFVMRDSRRNDAPPSSSTGAPGLPDATGIASNVEEHISLFGMMGGNKRRVSGSIFKTAELTSFMGACELDLRQAQMGVDGAAYIEVFAVMGGVHILIPPSWKVVPQITPIMGGVDDKTQPLPGAKPQTLYIRGTVMMGGAEIGN